MIIIKKNSLSIYITAVVVLLSSCVKDATIKLPEIASQLVVTSFISPSDTVIRVRVYQTKPLYQSNSISTENVIKDAVVYISDGSLSVNLPYDIYTGYYKISATALPILMGHTYNLTVSVPDGRSISAHTTVPNEQIAINFLSYNEFSHNVNNNPGNSMHTKIELEFNDPGYTGNYYRTIIKALSVNPSSPDTIIVSNDYVGLLKTQLDSDDQKNGTTITLKKSIDRAFSTDASLMVFDVCLFNCNYPYYAYHNSMSQAILSGPGGDPFSEPVIVYTNIEGGLGVFAAYVSSNKRINR